MPTTRDAVASKNGQTIDQRRVLKAKNIPRLLLVHPTDVDETEIPHISHLQPLQSTQSRL